MTKQYQFDPIQGIWSDRVSVAIPYSDGDEVENYLFSVVKRAKDVSVISSEMASAIKDWPSEYHLSPVRHHLLRPFAIGTGQRVLELGGGCGSMTRYLGETGATVLAVEGSQRRATIAAERCRDLPNVSIYRDNITEFESVEKFDYVTLIGVLEYAPKFIKADDPVGACLKHAQSFLKEDGTLILAIENQLGLKYFNGCSEDHLGTPYFGINGLYEKGDPVTFGRQALAGKLRQSGFPVQEYFYPFPDYKLPGLILSEAALNDARLNVADLLIHNTGRDYPESHHRAFAEDLAWRVVVENRLLADLANSFLILAHTSDHTLPKTDWLAKIYSRGQRRARYQVESTIAPDETGDLAVRKRKRFPDASVDDEWVRHAIADSAYLAGSLLVGKVHKAMARQAGIEELATCFGPWLKFLLANATRNEKNEHVLPRNFVDCIPANLIETTSGELLYFDAEWTSKDLIPFSWIVIRGITYSLIDCLENSSVRERTYRQCISYIAEKSGIDFHEDDFSTADECEARLVAQCHADSKGRPRLADIFDKPLFLIFRLTKPGPELAWQRAELVRIKSTVSWRITAPLRAIWNMSLKLIATLRT